MIDRYKCTTRYTATIQYELGNFILNHLMQNVGSSESLIHRVLVLGGTRSHNLLIFGQTPSRVFIQRMVTLQRFYYCVHVIFGKISEKRDPGQHITNSRSCFLITRTNIHTDVHSHIFTLYIRKYGDGQGIRSDIIGAFHWRNTFGWVLNWW